MTKTALFPAPIAVIQAPNPVIPVPPLVVIPAQAGIHFTLVLASY